MSFSNDKSRELVTPEFPIKYILADLIQELNL